MKSPTIKKCKTDDVDTPVELYHEFDKIFRFNLDVAANYNNRKCIEYIDIDADGIRTVWPNAARIWCHPPVSKVSDFAFKCANSKSIIVALFPLRVDSKWWIDSVQNGADHIILLQKRLRWATGNAWESYCVAIYNLPNLPIELRKLGLILSPRNSQFSNQP